MANINQMNVYLRCIVRARPSLSSLFWITDVNGTTVSDDDITTDYWSTVMVGSPYSLPPSSSSEFLTLHRHANIILSVVVPF